MIKNKIFSIFATFLSLLTFNAYAQQQSQYFFAEENAVMELRVFFKENSAVIDPEYLPEIDKVADLYLTQLEMVARASMREPNNPRFKFVHFTNLQGYTNKSEASKKSNATLAHKRAMAVKNAIVSSVQKISLKKYGSKIAFPTKSVKIIAEKKLYIPEDKKFTKQELEAMNRVVHGKIHIDMCCSLVPAQ